MPNLLGKTSTKYQGAPNWGSAFNQAFQYAQQIAQKKEAENQQLKGMLAKIVMEHQLRQQEAEEKFKRDASIKAFGMGMMPSEQGNITGPAGQTYQMMQPPQAPEGYTYGRKMPGFELREQSYKPRTKEEALEFKMAGAGYKPKTKEEALELKRAGRQKTDVSVNIGQKGFQKMAEEMSKGLVEERKNVEQAIGSYENIKELKNLLDQGVITGTGANFIVSVGNFLSSRLGIKFDNDPIANTQAYVAAVGTQVGQIIKQFGAGTGLSDADREYAERIAGGNITVTKDAILKIIAINEKALRNVVNRYNKVADQVMQRPESESLPFDLRIPYKFPEENKRFKILKVE